MINLEKIAYLVAGVKETKTSMPVNYEIPFSLDNSHETEVLGQAIKIIYKYLPNPPLRQIILAFLSTKQKYAIARSIIEIDKTNNKLNLLELLK